MQLWLLMVMGDGFKINDRRYNNIQFCYRPKNTRYGYILIVEANHMLFSSFDTMPEPITQWTKKQYQPMAAMGE